MSETKKKRVPKTKGELVEKLVDNSIQRFKEELHALEEKHGYKLEPAMYYSKMGAFPQIEVVKKKVEPTPEGEVVL
jgi:hypothetical protein